MDHRCRCSRFFGLRGLGREGFSVPHLSVNFRLYAQEGEESLPQGDVCRVGVVFQWGPDPALKPTGCGRASQGGQSHSYLQGPPAFPAQPGSVEGGPAA